MTRRRAGLLAGLTAAVHAAGAALLFTPPGALFSARPALEQDWGLHYHHSLAMFNFRESSGRLWGYDPFFMAGHLSNTIQDFSVKLFELAALASGAADPARALKIGAWIAAALIPLMIAAAAGWTAGGGDPREEAAGAESGEGKAARVRRTAVLAGILAAMAWWNSLPREMFFYGMIGFPPAAALAILVLAVFRAWREGDGSSRPLLAAGVLGAAILVPLHLQMAIPAALGGLVLVLGARRERRLPAAGGLCLAAAVAFAFNSFWLIPLWNHRADSMAADLVRTSAVFVSPDPLTLAKDYLTGAPYWSFRANPGEKLARLALLLLGAAGVRSAWRAGRKSEARFMAALAGSFLAFAYLGSFIPPLMAWQPLRFKVSLDFALTLPAAAALAALRIREWRRGSWILAGVAAGGGAGFLFNVFLVEIRSGGPNGPLRIATQPSPLAQAVIDWTAERVPLGARLLFEESGDESGFLYGGTYLSAFLPHGTARAVIGGPANLYNDRRHLGGFANGVLFGRSIEMIPSGELKELLDRFNIGAAAVYTKSAATMLLRSDSGFRLDRQAGPVFMMLRDRIPGWCFDEPVRVRAGFNRIEVERENRASLGDLTLKFHWVEGMKAEPPGARIEPAGIPGHPFPMIRVMGAPAKFAIRH